ncbi:MAG: CoA transferase, partial [Burkholderiales bacterium]|nr:CoA transferase [Burkholderiales bacterium]
ANRPGFDQIAQGMGGLMSVTGLPGQGPVRAGIAVADLTAGMFCTIGILMGLVERERSGKGQWVQTSLLQAQIAMLDFQAARWLVDGEVPGQAGNGHPLGVPTGTYPSADGHINVGGTGTTMWLRFTEAIGARHLQADPRFADAPERRRNRQACNEAISEILRGRTSAEWIERLNAARVPCGPIYTIDQVFADPQVRGLGMSQPVSHPKLGTLDLVAQPMSLSRTPSRLKTPTPEAGEHTEEILRELGFDTAHIDGLRRRKVV